MVEVERPQAIAWRSFNSIAVPTSAKNSSPPPAVAALRWFISGGDGVRQQFTLKEREFDTGLDYFLARYYSSVQGRFTSTDEFKGDPAELFVLGSGDPEKQALVYADVTNPQLLNSTNTRL